MANATGGKRLVMIPKFEGKGWNEHDTVLGAAPSKKLYRFAYVKRTWVRPLEEKDERDLSGSEWWTWRQASLAGLGLTVLLMTSSGEVSRTSVERCQGTLLTISPPRARLHYKKGSSSSSAQGEGTRQLVAS